MSGDGSNPWAWLGLLKWSLAYSDGTQSTNASPLSDEDKAFLESVMKDGIIDENERMKEILKDVTTKMETWKSTAGSDEQVEEVEILLQELRDIVEQIDYARAFSAMNGISFLLGCVQEVSEIPKTIRVACLGIIATMCQNNPPVQKKLLEMSSVKILSDLFFATTSADDDNGNVRARTIQAISANVRSYELAENVFCELEQSKSLIETGLGMNADDTPNTIRMRTVFLVQALLSSDTLSQTNIEKFSPYMIYCIDSFLYETVDENNYDIMEMVLSMIEKMLEARSKCVNVILSKSEYLSTMASHRITTISNMQGDAREFFSREYDLWESISDLMRTVGLMMTAAADTETLSDDEGPSDDEDEDDL